MAYNTVARWITGLPHNTRTTNLITLAHLPPMEAYLDYLSLRYAIWLHFLPTHHTLGPPRDLPDTRTNLPGLHRLFNLSKHLMQGKLEDRTATLTAPGKAKTTSPNPDKTTQPRQCHKNWLRTLNESTIVIYTERSKLENGDVRCGCMIHYSRNQQLHFLSDGCCHLGRRAEVYKPRCTMPNSTRCKRPLPVSLLPQLHTPQCSSASTTRPLRTLCNSTHPTMNMHATPSMSSMTSSI